MKVPVSWLQEFFTGPLPPVTELVKLLDGLGLSVEAVTELPAAPKGVRVVEVLSAEATEGSNDLKATKVSDGEREHLVVCGAPNVRPGMRAALATVGSTLPGGITVGEREIRGVKSSGMLVSPREVDLFDYAGGLLELGDDAPLGAELAELWPEETVIELEVTPNRADAFSLLGVARDLAAKLNVPYEHPAAGYDLGDPAVDDGLELEIMDPACPRFVLRGVRGVSVRPSPIWLQRRLAALGLRPRNNLVDVTNYVTFELGQPSHAYDLATLGRGTLQVRRAEPGESLELLTGESVELTGDDLLIATPGEGGASLPAGLAGVMGGSEFSVTEETRAVALEVANFDPVAVRRAGQRHRLITDARTRFERGVDLNLQELAAARAAALIAEVAGGEVEAGVTLHGADSRREPVPFRPERVEFLMDFRVPEQDQRRYLRSLGLELIKASGAEWLVRPPSWRFDISIEEDVVEEVARLHGYEHIGESVPDMHFVPSPADPTHFELKLRLAQHGLQEIIRYVFTGESELARARAPKAHVRLSDPQGVERSVLRTALYPGLLAAAATNRRRGQLGFFEIGRVFLEDELERLALLSAGPKESSGWGAELKGDFYTFKGILEGIALSVGASLTAEPTGEAPHLHPGVAAALRWNGQYVGTLGRLHPEVARAFELGEVYVAELALPLPGRRIQFEEINRQPHAVRDLAVVLPLTATYAELAALLETAAGPLLKGVAPFDVYRGGELGEGKQSIAVHLSFQAPGRALTDAEVDDVMQNVMRAVEEAGYHVRA